MDTEDKAQIELDSKCLESLGVGYTDVGNFNRLEKYNLVNESGLYNLIFKSSKPEAKLFKKWVTEEVLPSIRKTGSYSIPIHNKKPYHKFLERYNLNIHNVSNGYFSIISEIYVRLYNKLETFGYVMPDFSESTKKELRPEVSVGKRFPKWLEENYPEFSNCFVFYNHTLPNGKTIDARQYENKVLPCFIEFIEKVWIPECSIDYFMERDQQALPYLKKVLITLGYNQLALRLDN